MGLAARLRAWRRHLDRSEAPIQFREIAFFPARDEIPHPVPDSLIAIAGTLERPKWCVFTCPCARGHEITLNMQRSYWPHWRLMIHGGLPTIRPSVDLQDPPYCHFTILRGRILWALQKNEARPGPRTKGA